ncbi:MAG: Bacterial regulatory protein luxR family [Solirubrobacteraceae bacterium]|jgi:DNA-binding CsgD family transcriptional regulator|nr:Bacterial regulatory protein luxR family [Solirubrobacteraceae bacterium]
MTERNGLPATGAGSRGDLVRCGAELVALSERFYGGVFVAAFVFVGLAALAALALVPVRPLLSPELKAVAFAATGLIAAATLAALRHSGALYRALRRRVRLQVALALVAAALVAHPALADEIWWPSCAILMALAIVAPLGRALAYCLLVLVTDLAGHLVAADLHDAAAGSLIGPWIVYPTWVVTVGLLTDRFSAHILGLNAMRAAEPADAEPPRRAAEPADAEPPRRVVAQTRNRALAHNASAASGHDSRPRRWAPHEAGGSMTARLSARQSQVVVLLADGLRYRDIAACLSISERQVQRHVGEAVARLGVRNAYELTALAVSEGIVPGPRDR